MRRAALLALLAACASTARIERETAADVDTVRAATAARAGGEPPPRAGAPDDGSIDAQVRGMLAGELDEATAVKVALLNNRVVRERYERLGIARADLVPIHVTFPAGYLHSDEPKVVSLRVNYDDQANAATTDTFESAQLGWTAENGPGLSQAETWSRVTVNAAQHLMRGPELGSGSDLRLVSPPIAVGTSPFTLAFRQRHQIIDRLHGPGTERLAGFELGWLDGRRDIREHGCASR